MIGIDQIIQISVHDAIFSFDITCHLTEYFLIADLCRYHEKLQIIKRQLSVNYGHFLPNIGYGL
jgi:hypothetical protein